MKRKIKNILLITLGVVLGLTVGAKAATTIASTSVTYGDTTVQAALDELMNIANQCSSGALCSKAKIGDYISMTPLQTTYTILSSSTGYSINQTIKPNQLNLWRVIKKNGDGTMDIISEYTSKQRLIMLTTNEIGYFNLIRELNLIASQYENSKYTVRSRYMGYGGQTSVITDQANIYEAFTTSTVNNDNEFIGGGDILYENDIELVLNALGTLVAYEAETTTAGAYWLASRYYDYAPGWGVLAGRMVSQTGSVEIASPGVFINLRPIVTLRSDITSFSGSGTIASPWVLS